MASYSQTVLADNPIVFTMLDPSSLTDLSTNALPLTAHGTLTPTATGLAGLPTGAAFGGTTSDYVSTPDTSILDFTGDFSFETWVNYTVTPASAYILMSKGQESGVAASYEMYISSADHISVDLANVTAGARFARGPANDGNWHQVVVTRIGNAWVLYDNGSSTDSLTQAITPANTSRAFTWGVNTNSSGVTQQPLVGSQAASSAYTYGLSPTQVAAHYAARNTPDPPTQLTLTLPRHSFGGRFA